MRYFLLLPITVLLITSCGLNFQERNQDRLAPASPEVQCRGKAPEALAATLNSFRLAQPQDFVPVIQQLDQQPPANRPTISYTCSIFTADFNQDGQKDYAVLLVNPQTQTSQFRLAIAQSGNTFTNAVVRDYPKPPAPIPGSVYTAMLLKPPGEAGPANRSYFPLKPGTPEREQFVAGPAIEVWLSPETFLSGVSPQLPEDERFNQVVGYGSEVFYFVNGQLKTTQVAD
jgi:hypothetical protein